MKILTTLFLAGSLQMPALANQSPYAGQQDRPIKALSESQVQAYLNGGGMGYAKAAELNDYPGPKHVLELAAELELSTEQVADTNRLYEAMRSEAIALGRVLIDQERELDGQFASAAITPESLKELIENIAELEAKIRFVHLNAHLRQKALLTQSQASRYNRLRGYSHNHNSNKN